MPPFKTEENTERLLLNFVETYNFVIIPFNIQLNGFNHFGNRVLYVDVMPSVSLSDMEKDINIQFGKEFPLIIFRNKQAFHPHVTIATRDISEHKFNVVWHYFLQHMIDAKNDCKELSLMKLDKEVWHRI